MSLEIIILAAGKGKRMHSSLPKVLHKIGGKPILQHLLESTQKLKPARTHVVVGHGKDQIIEKITPLIKQTASIAGNRLHSQLNWVVQTEQLGTGHAVMQALPKIKRNTSVLILNGDIPLITAKTLKRVANSKEQLNLLTVKMDNPTGLGRILRDHKGQICGIVEEKDASKQQKTISEVNTNCLSGKAGMIEKWLSGVGCNNAQKEFYLTDVIACAVNDGIRISAVSPTDVSETLGVNNQSELARLERTYQLQQAQILLEKGVTLIDPARIDIRGTCKFGNDCTVDINVILEGNVKIGNGVVIGPHTLIRNAQIGSHTVIEANSVIDSSKIGRNCNIGPFARIRPETELKDRVRVGNFVETKKSMIGAGSKINHLSYVGDSDLGRDVNIGAGVITCNYDGANKHKTVIGNNVFVGSDSQFVAPVSVADGATIGAGSTITDNVEKDALVVSRIRQRSIKNWKRPRKKALKKQC